MPGKKRWGKIMVVVIGIIVAFNVVLISAGVILRETHFKGNFSKIQPYGQIVEVFDGTMNVFSQGNGDETIVLLPGLGVGLPSADFGPLMRKLSENYRVVVLEYFGVGFSSVTSRPRSNANYVEEIREALLKAGFPGPYVLMPHSISGIYAEYYASRYPDEVRAIINLDGTSTAYWQKTPAILNAVIPLAKVQQASGLTALLGTVITNRSKLKGYGYTEREISDMITFAAFSVNDTLLDQIIASMDFVKEIKDVPFPETVPYLKIISRDTFEKPNRQLKISPQEYQFEHLAKIGAHGQYEILEGNHFIYWNNVERIAELTSRFLTDTEIK
ncbi:alpha/beta fold hydrolase [Spirochaeta dissipatitropha]